MVKEISESVSINIYKYKGFELSMDENGYYQSSKKGVENGQKLWKSIRKFKVRKFEVEWQPCLILSTTDWVVNLPV